MFKEFNHLFVFISTNNQVARRSCDNFTKDSNLRPRVECTERERIFATVDGFWVEINPRIFRKFSRNTISQFYFSNSRRIFVVSTGQLFSMICDNWERLELYCAINVIESIGGVIGERFRKERCKYSFLFSSLSPSFPCLFVFFFVYRVFIKMWFQATTKRTIR